MFTLKGKRDAFRCTLPKEFLMPEIVEKYSKILQKAHSFYTTPIDFLNETIQGVDVLGFTQATVQQQQTGRGTFATSPNTIEANKFLHTATDFTYRSEMNPLQLIDKTIRLKFRHTLGYINYFMLFENFFYQYRRDTKYSQLPEFIPIYLLDENMVEYAKLMLYHPMIDGMDMLSFDFTSPTAQSETFNLEMKYSNIDFDFIEKEDKDANYYIRQTTSVI